MAWQEVTNNVPELIDQLGKAARSKTYIGYSDMGFLLGALYGRKMGTLVHGPAASDYLEEVATDDEGEDEADREVHPEVLGAGESQRVDVGDPGEPGDRASGDDRMLECLHGIL